MKGNLTRRGKASWRLKFDTGRDPVSGRRITKFVTLRGTKAQAQAEATKILAEIAAGTHVEPSKITVGEFVRARINQWETAGTISARTAQRYRQLLRHQIAPHIGSRELQKLRPLDVEEWHTTLRNSGRVARQRRCCRANHWPRTSYVVQGAQGCCKKRLSQPQRSHAGIAAQGKRHRDGDRPRRASLTGKTTRLSAASSCSAGRPLRHALGRSVGVALGPRQSRRQDRSSP